MEKPPPLDFQSFLADEMRDYLDYLDHLGYSIISPAHNLRRIDAFLLRKRIEDVRQLDVRLLMQLNEEFRGRVRANTLRLYRQTFDGLCRYLMRLGRMTDNPVAGFPRPRPQPYVPHVFSPQELRSFFDFLKTDARQAEDGEAFYRAQSRYTIHHLLYACGLRVSEAVALAETDYSPRQATLFIRPSKFGKDRLIPIGGRACSNLNNLLALRRSLFPDSTTEGRIFLHLPEARPYSRQWVSASFRRVMRRLGIYHGPRLRNGCLHGTPHLHELRRAFAVHRLLRWYRLKEDVDAKLPLLATYMGHACFEHTKTHLTLTRQLLDQAAGRFAGRFDRLDWVEHDPRLG